MYGLRCTDPTYKIFIWSSNFFRLPSPSLACEPFFFPLRLPVNVRRECSDRGEHGMTHFVTAEHRGAGTPGAVWSLVRYQLENVGAQSFAQGCPEQTGRHHEFGDEVDVPLCSVAQRTTSRRVRTIAALPARKPTVRRKAAKSLSVTTSCTRADRSKVMPRFSRIVTPTAGGRCAPPPRAIHSMRLLPSKGPRQAAGHRLGRKAL